MRSLRTLLPLLLLASSVLPAAEVGWKTALAQPDGWYATAAARTLADSVLLYQTPVGGWPKNTDFSDPPTEEFLEDARMDHRAATIDNNATTTPLRFLARVLAAAPDDRTRTAFERGFDYLLAAQYENGGWPQYFPLQKGYYTHITYNDNAMVNVLEFLRQAARGEPPYTFVDEARRNRATAAVAKGIDCILRTQVRDAEGHLTAWCAQHDETTLAPAWARNFEPPTLSGGESVGIVRFLIGIETPSPEVRAAIEGAVNWFSKVKITGLRYETFKDADGKKDRRVVPDPSAPSIWARFYELGTDRPLFMGRDKVVHYALADIERERRVGYGYYTTSPSSLLESQYPKWRKRLEKAAAPVTKATGTKKPAKSKP
jgi:PelA/Pel-15E family pectate lyase